MRNVGYVISLVLILISTTECINITSDPVKCSRNNQCVLKCNIGEITETVKWLYKGSTYFSCSPPYSAGICYIHSPSWRYNFKINVTSGIITSRVYVGRSNNVGIWTCIHGDERVILDIGAEDRATVSSFQTPSSSSEGDVLSLVCKVSSKLPVDVNITITNVQHGRVILRQVKKSSLRSITTTVKARCGYQVFQCVVWNGYGIVSTYRYSRRYKCPHQILHDQTNTTVEAVVGAPITYFRLYYTGYPGYPTATWYRRDGNHEIKLNAYRVSQSYTSQYLYMYIRYVYIQDAGQYSIHVNISGRMEIVVFTLNVKMPKISTDPICVTTTMNPTSDQSTQVITVADNSAQSLHQSDEPTFSSTIGIGIGVGIGVVGTLILVGIIVLVVWLKNRHTLITDTCPTMKSLERNVRKTKKTTKAGVDNVNMEVYDNTEENVEYENYYVG